MARTSAAKRTQKSRKSNANKNNTKSFFKRNHLSSFVAGFGGAAFGIALMLAVALPMLHRQLQSDVASLNHSVVAMSPADMTTGLACSSPTGGSGSGAFSTGQNQPTIQTASATMPSTTPVGGMGGGPTGSSGGNVITKIIGEYQTENHATISNTGADSTNKINQTTTNTTTVDNDNDIFAVNNNPQTASSGNVTSSQNTTAGSTTSGSATNKSNTSFVFKINN